MRNGQNKRMRGRNRKGGHHHQNPLSRVYESNGQDVKIRGTASHIAEKYLQLARDAQSSGDPIAAENYYQHAEHYFRLIAAAQEQLRQSQPYYQPQPGGSPADEGYDDGDEQPQAGEPYAPQGQPFYQREPQPYQQQHHQAPHHQSQPPQHQPQPQPQHFQPRPQQHAPQDDADVDRLPSFITGGQPQSQPPAQHAERGNGPAERGNGPNGYDGSADRFPLHRRRRRHRGGGRDYAPDQSASADHDGAAQAGADSADE